MTKEKQNEFNQRFEKIINQLPLDDKEALDWSYSQTDSGIDFEKAFVSLGLIRKLSKDKVMELKNLVDTFGS